MNEEDDKIAGIAAANLVAIEAMKDALEKAGIIPEGLVVHANEKTMPPNADRSPGFSDGVAFVSGFMKLCDTPPRPEWHRGVIDG
ncbi:MAG: hypothetical protein IH805_09505, partial [Proteobacteria bacterium]|nr:hypothetical protein [Pseudomonadota bacterium]